MGLAPWAAADAALPTACLEPTADTGTSTNTTASPTPTADTPNVVIPDGRAMLGAPELCSSYACRAALASQPHPLFTGAALGQSMLACALPATPGEYSLLDFQVTGLNVQTEASWWGWLQEASFRLCQDKDALIRGTWFPTGSNQWFYVTAAAGVNATGLLTTVALSQVLNEVANPPLPGTTVPAAPIQVTELHASLITVQQAPGDKAREQLWYGQLLVGAVVVYSLLALLAYEFGPSWLPPLVLCWPELCDGRGCLIYRVLFMPLVLVYNAITIYCGSCLMTYLVWMGRTPACQRCCWHEFTDPDFPPNERSVGKVEGDTASGVVEKGGGVAWAKASEIAAAANKGAVAHLFQGAIEPSDVLQGALGDCWLMAALACVAERPGVLEQAIVTKHVDPRGKYYFRLWNQVKNSPGTKWVTIVVDENIPVHPGTLKPKFARSHCNEMWVMLLEKAFAKMYGGYDRLDGGQMYWALTAITGNPAVTLCKEKPGEPWSSERETLTDDQLFRLLLKLRRNGAFLCCAMIAQSDKMGLIDGHAYSIIQLRQVRRSAVDTAFFRLVQIRNPHGQTEWQGHWSDKSELWNQFPYVMRELCAENRVEDGTFWMEWEDFCKFWKEVQVVDAGSNIRTTVPPIYNETLGGPILACLVGCWEYWFSCLGFRRLYCSRGAAKNLSAMEEGMDSPCGMDQEGFFCEFCERHPASAASSSAKEANGDSFLEHEPDEFEPLCAWMSSVCPSCGHRAAAPVSKPSSSAKPTKVNGRTLSRT